MFGEKKVSEHQPPVISKLDDGGPSTVVAWGHVGVLPWIPTFTTLILIPRIGDEPQEVERPL